LDEALQDAGPATSVPLPWCKKSYVRILVQAMEELGYRNSAAALEREAGVRLKSDIVTQLQDAVLQGRWEEVEVLARRGEDWLDVLDEAERVKLEIEARGLSFPWLSGAASSTPPADDVEDAPADDEDDATDGEAPPEDGDNSGN
jgi:hypothetical protein